MVVVADCFFSAVAGGVDRVNGRFRPRAVYLHLVLKNYRCSEWVFPKVKNPPRSSLKIAKFPRRDSRTTALTKR